jgi:hypothetical protein
VKRELFSILTQLSAWEDYSRVCYVCFILLLLYPEQGSSRFLRNFSNSSRNCIVLHFRRQTSNVALVKTSNSEVFHCWTEGDWEQNAERIFGQKRDEVTGGWRKLHNEGLHNLYSLSSIIKMMKSRIVRWKMYAVRIRRGLCTAFRWESQKEGDHYEDLDVSGKIILIWILEGCDIDWCGVYWNNLTQNRVQWSFFLNTVVNLKVPKDVEKLSSVCNWRLQNKGSDPLIYWESIDSMIPVRMQGVSKRVLQLWNRM